MKPFANIPGVTYPDDSAPESKIERSVPKPLRVYVPHKCARHTIQVEGRNYSTLWMRRNGLEIRVIDGVRTVVPK